MVDFDKSKTKENLARAFAGECQDGARYQFMAKLAEKEGYSYLKSIFKTHAKNEMAHAQRFFDLIVTNSKVKDKNIEIHGGYPFTSGDLLSSIKDAMGVEESQSGNVYPEFAKTAKEEGFDHIAFLFEEVGKIEKEHEERYLKLLGNINDNLVFQKGEETVWICRNCGHIYKGEQAPEECPVCAHPQSYFEVRKENY